MDWNAKRVSDYVLHRRRVILACVGLAGSAAVLSGVAMTESFSVKEAFTGTWAAGSFVFFGVMAVREWRLMKASAQ